MSSAERPIPSVSEVANHVFSAGSVTMEIPHRNSTEARNPLHGQTVRLRTRDRQPGEPHSVVLEQVPQDPAQQPVELGGGMGRTPTDALTVLLHSRPVVARPLFDRVRG